MFQLHYAPADTIEDANEIAREAYIWLEETRRTAKVESETSVVAVNTRPELVVSVLDCKLYSFSRGPIAS